MSVSIWRPLDKLSEDDPLLPDVDILREPVGPVVDEDADDDTEDDDETEIIYQRYLKKLKDSGYKRTTPGDNPEAKNKFPCNKCSFHGKDSNTLTTHVKTVHVTYKNTERKNAANNEIIKYCHHWNNFGSCHFETKNGRPCKFVHRQAPRCNFDGKCNRKLCMYMHQNQNMSFLASAQMNSRPPVNQRNPRSAPSPWIQGGTRRGGNTRQF